MRPPKPTFENTMAAVDRSLARQDAMLDDAHRFLGSLQRRRAESEAEVSHAYVIPPQHQVIRWSEQNILAIIDLFLHLHRLEKRIRGVEPGWQAGEARHQHYKHLQYALMNVNFNLTLMIGQYKKENHAAFMTNLSSKFSPSLRKFINAVNESGYEYSELTGHVLMTLMADLRHTLPGGKFESAYQDYLKRYPDIKKDIATLPEQLPESLVMATEETVELRLPSETLSPATFLRCTDAMEKMHIALPRVAKVLIHCHSVLAVMIDVMAAHTTSAFYLEAQSLQKRILACLSINSTQLESYFELPPKSANWNQKALYRQFIIDGKAEKCGDDLAQKEAYAQGATVLVLLCRLKDLFSQLKELNPESSETFDFFPEHFISCHDKTATALNSIVTYQMVANLHQIVMPCLTRFTAGHNYLEEVAELRQFIDTCYQRWEKTCWLDDEFKHREILQSLHELLLAIEQEDADQAPLLIDKIEAELDSYPDKPEIEVIRLYRRIFDLFRHMAIKAALYDAELGKHDEYQFQIGAIYLVFADIANVESADAINLIMKQLKSELQEHNAPETRTLMKFMFIAEECSLYQYAKDVALDEIDTDSESTCSSTASPSP